MAAATLQAPLISSGWLREGRAEALAMHSVSSSVSKLQPTGETRMAEPLPKLAKGLASLLQAHSQKRLP